MPLAHFDPIINLLLESLRNQFPCWHGCGDDPRLEDDSHVNTQDTRKGHGSNVRRP